MTIFKDLKESFNLIEFFIQKDKKIRIPVLGGYSTGKSSLLNSIIGKKLLPEGNLVTTKNAVVIRNNNENKYILYETKFKPKGEYYIFEEGDIKVNCDESNYHEIYNFLDNENKKEKKITKENMFYLLSCPILLFKEMNFDKDILDILNKIEFIDYPGIDVRKKVLNNKDVEENNIEMEVFNPLILLSDTFIFVNNYNLINNQDNIKNIQKIVDSIENRKFNFDYKSCLFILNKCDEGGNINVDESKKQIENILFGKKKFNYKDFFKKEENQEISVSLFSNIYFERYLLFSEKLKNFKKYIEDLIEDIKIINDEEDYDLIDEIKDSLKTTFEQDYDLENDQEFFDIDKKEYLSQLSTLLEKNGISSGNINEHKEDLLEIIRLYILMKKEIKQTKDYVYMKILIQKLNEKFKIAHKMTEKQYEEKIKEFVNRINIIFQLLQQKSLKKKVIDLSETEIERNNKLIELNIEFKSIVDLITSEIDNSFKKCIDKINELILKGENNEATISELKKEIEKFKKFYYDEIERINNFIIKQINFFKISLNNKIIKTSEEYLSESIISDIKSGGYLSLGTKIIIGVIVAIPALAITLFAGVLAVLGGIMGKIIDLFKSKESIIKNLKELKVTIFDQWTAISFKTNLILNKIVIKASQDINMIYDSQLVEINEKTLQELYDKFLNVIGNRYEGELINDKKEGFGCYYWYDGSKYEGYFKNDNREGFGKMFWENGQKYIGFWKDGNREGFGKYYFNSQNIYKGEFCENKLNGIGSYISINLYKFEGEHKDGIREGFGIYYWNDGNKYIGYNKNGCESGIGINYYPDGCRYEGEFNEGGKDGIGTFYYSNGNKFEGEWKNNKKNGKGIFYLKNGKKYEGFWNNDIIVLNNYITDKEYIINVRKQFNKNKILINYVDGNTYLGEYSPDKLVIEGNGSYYFNDGKIYKGHFKNNQFEGKGELINSLLGIKMIGNFKQGEFHGKGEIEYENGNKLIGEWIYGKKEGQFVYQKKNGDTIVTENLQYKNNKLIED